MFDQPEQVKAFLTQNINQSNKILVIGDVVLDKYYYGEVKRISPEAPVPVTKVTDEKNTLGGAANVAHNLSKLGIQVLLGGISGQDANRECLCDLLGAQKINYSGLLATNRPTITKIRVIGSHQQMLRLDFENDHSINQTIENRLKEWIVDSLNMDLKGVIISDYAKGLCTPGFCQFIIRESHQRHIPVLVDPKGNQWEKYRGVDFISPNLKELGDAVGVSLANEDPAIEIYAKKVQEDYDIANVIVTRSEKGLSMIHSSRAIHISTHAREVFDVSGAGDTVVSAFMAALASNVNPFDAVRLANIAAGVVVGKVGTYAISKDELQEAVQLVYGKQDGTSRKLVNWVELAELLRKWRDKGEKIVFTNGCFDILHVGHVSYLEKASGLGHHLIIGLNSDASIRRIKGDDRPIVKEKDRARLLAALECVSCVAIFDEDTPAELIHLVKPDVLVKGGDYRPDQVVGKEDAGQVEIIQFEEGYSTTGIIEKVLQQYGMKVTFP
jgi:D-beta-D-heptose 7-phosphate kinase / D-beta-D-heptose 1-phosphate adenosyltransferase